eukprot:2432050-Rhodomonas_salina.1
MAEEGARLRAAFVAIRDQPATRAGCDSQQQHARAAAKRARAERPQSYQNNAVSLDGRWGKRVVLYSEQKGTCARSSTCPARIRPRESLCDDEARTGLGGLHRLLRLVDVEVLLQRASRQRRAQLPHEVGIALANFKTQPTPKGSAHSHAKDPQRAYDDKISCGKDKDCGTVAVSVGRGSYLHHVDEVEAHVRLRPPQLAQFKVQRLHKRQQQSCLQNENMKKNKKTRFKGGVCGPGRATGGRPGRGRSCRSRTAPRTATAQPRPPRVSSAHAATRSAYTPHRTHRSPHRTQQRTHSTQHTAQSTEHTGVAQQAAGSNAWVERGGRAYEDHGVGDDAVRKLLDVVLLRLHEAQLDAEVGPVHPELLSPSRFSA